jgi:hypothetical protein
MSSIRLRPPEGWGPSAAACVCSKPEQLETTQALTETQRQRLAGWIGRRYAIRATLASVIAASLFNGGRS